MNMHVGIVKKLYVRTPIGIIKKQLATKASFRLASVKMLFIKYSKSAIKTKVCAVGQ